MILHVHKWILFSKFAVICSLMVHCDGATVQFFKFMNFTGEAGTLTSSAVCQRAPTYFQDGAGATIKTSDCIAAFATTDCTLFHEPWDKIIETDTTGGTYTVRSFRDCTDLEKGSQGNLDFFSEEEGKGQSTSFRNMCSCANLPTYNTSFQSINIYGNCFNLYTEWDCGGHPSETDRLRYTYTKISGKRSVKPCELPGHCNTRLLFTASVFNISPVGNVSTSEDSKKYVVMGGTNQTFVNNGTEPQEWNYEANLNVIETGTFQLSSVLHQLDSIKIGKTVLGTSEIKIIPNFTNFKFKIGNKLESIFQNHSKSISNETIDILMSNERELKIQQKIFVHPCTNLEAVLVNEVAANSQIGLRVQFTITGEQFEGLVIADEIPNHFRNIVFSKKQNDLTAVGETTGKFIFDHVIRSRVNFTTTPIQECRKRFLKLKAIVYEIEPLTNFSGLSVSVNRIPIFGKEIFINNGTAPQENKFEAAKKIIETAQFEFPEALNQIHSVGFGEDFNVDFENSPPLVELAWHELKNGLSDNFQNRQNLEEPMKFSVQKNEACHVQNTINVPPCMKYEVDSFVEVAENVLLEYRIQIKLTGKLGSEDVGVDEIRDSLEGFTFLENKDYRTVLAETSVKLKLKYVIASGVNAEGQRMLDCLEAHAAIVANCKFVCSG